MCVFFQILSDVSVVVICGSHSGDPALRMTWWNEKNWSLFPRLRLVKWPSISVDNSSDVVPVLLLCSDSMPRPRPWSTDLGPRSWPSRNTAHVTCFSLQENSLSLIVSDLPTNCRAYLRRLTDSKTLLFVILWTVYSVSDVFLLFVWLCSPALELPYNSKLIDWLIDW